MHPTACGRVQPLHVVRCSRGLSVKSAPICVPAEKCQSKGKLSDCSWEEHMSMTAGEGDGGAGIMDDASCNTEEEMAIAAVAAAAAAACSCKGSLVECRAGDGDCSCGGVSPGWGVESVD